MSRKRAWRGEKDHPCREGKRRVQLQQQETGVLRRWGGQDEAGKKAVWIVCIFFRQALNEGLPF